MVDKDSFGFGDMVRVEKHGHEIEGEVVAAGPDNRDLDDDRHVIAVSGTDVQRYDEIEHQEIIHETDVISARAP